MNRSLQVKATGQWLAPMLSDAQFGDDGKGWADAVAETFGLEPGALTVVDWQGTDPRTGTLLKEDVPPPVPVEAPLLEQLLDAIAASPSHAALVNAAAALKGKNN